MLRSYAAPEIYHTSSSCEVPRRPAIEIERHAQVPASLHLNVSSSDPSLHSIDPTLSEKNFCSHPSREPAPSAYRVHRTLDVTIFEACGCIMRPTERATSLFRPSSDPSLSYRLSKPFSNNSLSTENLQLPIPPDTSAPTSRTAFMVPSSMGTRRPSQPSTMPQSSVNQTQETRWAQHGFGQVPDQALLAFRIYFDGVLVGRSRLNTPTEGAVWMQTFCFEDNLAPTTQTLTIEVLCRLTNVTTGATYAQPLAVTNIPLQTLFPSVAGETASKCGGWYDLVPIDAVGANHMSSSGPKVPIGQIRLGFVPDRTALLETHQYDFMRSALAGSGRAALARTLCSPDYSNLAPALIKYYRHTGQMLEVLQELLEDEQLGFQGRHQQMFFR